MAREESNVSQHVCHHPRREARRRRAAARQAYRDRLSLEQKIDRLVSRGAPPASNEFRKLVKLQLQQEGRCA